MTNNKYPDCQASKIWEHDGIRFYLVPPSTERFQKHYCGYARFEQRPVIEEGYDGILNYVPVHGGITYAKQDDDGSMVYGFDCGHSGDNERPELRDEEWLGAECDRMARAIQLAAEYETAFLSVGDDTPARAQVLDLYHAKLREQNINFDLKDNFGAMINVLFGKL